MVGEGAEDTTMQELNPYYQQIQDLQGRTEALRGYL